VLKIWFAKKAHSIRTGEIGDQRMGEYTSYRFGAGRYIQETDALDHSGSEVSRFGKRAYVIGGPHAISAVESRMNSSFKQAGVSSVWEIYDGFPSYRKLEELKEAIKNEKCDVIVGVGGGRIMDLTKATAADLGYPVVLIPTSAATCASYSPLSVMYTDEGKCVGYLHFDYEINAVLVDEQIMTCQPPRLLAAGIMDAMAKCIEIANGKPEITLKSDGIEKYSAYRMAEDIYDILEQYGEAAYEDVMNQTYTETLHNVIFCTIALTGIVSAIMRAKGQTALAHRMYETLRTHYFRESINYLHGEIVATGLIAQLKFNNNTEAIKRLSKYMKKMSMPMNLRELGLSGSSSIQEKIHKILCESEFVPDTAEDYQRVWEAIQEIR
jgi:glycerol dehydrogenase